MKRASPPALSSTAAHRPDLVAQSDQSVIEDPPTRLVSIDGSQATSPRASMSRDGVHIGDAAAGEGEGDVARLDRQLSVHAISMVVLASACVLVLGRTGRGGGWPWPFSAWRDMHTPSSSPVNTDTAVAAAPEAPASVTGYFRSTDTVDPDPLMAPTSLPLTDAMESTTEHPLTSSDSVGGGGGGGGGGHWSMWFGCVGAVAVVLAAAALWDRCRRRRQRALAPPPSPRSSGHHGMLQRLLARYDL
jgi:hypothetical protein